MKSLQNWAPTTAIDLQARFSLKFPILGSSIPASRQSTLHHLGAFEEAVAAEAEPAVRLRRGREDRAFFRVHACLSFAPGARGFRLAIIVQGGGRGERNPGVSFLSAGGRVLIE